ncbi:MAG: glycosyltransferase [Gillisia sp.]
MQKEKISIIIPCYNDAIYVEKAVQSALSQTYDNKEVIVVDDGSNENTKRVLQNLEPKINRLISQENKGTSSARNTGIAAATGEYILILDSDDYFEKTFCDKALKILQQKNDIKAVSCYSNWFSDRGTKKLFKPEGGDLKNILLKNTAMGSILFRKGDWERVGGYDIKMKKGYEDWEFYIRLLRDGGEIYILPEVLFNYRNRENSRNKKANLVKYEIIEYIFLKHELIYKEHFEFFVKEWLISIKESEIFKQEVIDSRDYKIGKIFLKPLRILGFFKRKNRS